MVDVLYIIILYLSQFVYLLCQNSIILPNPQYLKRMKSIKNVEDVFNLFFMLKQEVDDRLPKNIAMAI
jgi:hypothetical protein